MYLVTGAAGLIGSGIVWYLNRNNIDDILAVDHLGTSEKWRNLRALKFRDDLEKDDFRRKLAAGMFDHLPLDGIFHMGACSATTEQDASYLVDNNFEASKELALFALKRQVRLIYASSCATYGDGGCGYVDDQAAIADLRPLNMYGYSKQMFDLWAYRENLLKRIASVKFFNVYGPNEYHKGEMKSVACKAFTELRETGSLRLFKSDRPQYPDGGQMRDFVYVKDCVNVMFWLLEHPEANGILNIGSGKARTWNDLANAVYAAMDKIPDINYIDMPATLKGRYQYYTQAEMSWLERLGCDVSFHTLEDGVSDYIKNYLMNPDPYL